MLAFAGYLPQNGTARLVCFSLCRCLVPRTLGLYPPWSYPPPQEGSPRCPHLHQLSHLSLRGPWYLVLLLRLRLLLLLLLVFRFRLSFLLMFLLALQWFLLLHLWMCMILLLQPRRWLLHPHSHRVAVVGLVRSALPPLLQPLPLACLRSPLLRYPPLGPTVPYLPRRFRLLPVATFVVLIA